jgi:hypothetical protein
MSCLQSAETLRRESFSRLEPPNPAYNINLVLDRLGVIKIVRVGDPRPNGKASKFRYLLSQSENGAEEDDGGLEI